METFSKNRVVVVRPAAGTRALDVRDNLVHELKGAGIPYLHVGAGVHAAYAVVPEGVDYSALEDIAVSCNAFVGGSGYVMPENFETDELDPEWLEQALANHPIEYDILIDRDHDCFVGLCGQCGGVGSHIGPPCIT